MDGFKQPPRPGVPPEPSEEPVSSVETSAPISSPTTPETSSHKLELASSNASTSEVASASSKRRKWLLKVIVAILIMLLLASIGAFVWYYKQLAPVDADSDTKQQFVITDGESFSDIASRLKEHNLIRNPLAFDIAARMSGERTGIKAGTCSLTPAMPSRDILEKLIGGCHDFKSITFYPGATIEKPFYKSPSATLSQTMYVKYMLEKAGFDSAEIERGLSMQYDNPLFAGKPRGTTLEGYIYGETYYVATDASVESVLQTAFDEMYKVVKSQNLPAAYKKQGLETLYDGITMASIVQRELNCEDKPTPERKDRCYQYQRKIAQVLLKRLDEGIPLGADVTFIYAADMAGKQPTIGFKSPYNTRIHAGLPPGPIGSPGKLALKAVADPSDTDYLYFVAGDDGLIHFAKTQAEHDKNTHEYCQKLCFELN